MKQLDKNGFKENIEFLEEVSRLSALQHPNLVDLIGYCVEGDQKLLVYDYMPNGSLKDNLFGKFLFLSSVMFFSKSIYHNHKPNSCILKLSNVHGNNLCLNDSLFTREKTIRLDHKDESCLRSCTSHAIFT